MTQTWWLSFTDPDKPKGQQFLGVVVVDVDEGDVALATPVANAIRQHRALPPITDPDVLMMAAALQKTHRLGCNPGGQVLSVRIDDAPEFATEGTRYPRGRLLARADIEAIEADTSSVPEPFE